MKVFGQFASTQTANNYARIRSYIETCRRNGINEIDALCRLYPGDRPIYGRRNLFYNVIVRKRSYITPLNIAPVIRRDNCDAIKTVNSNRILPFRAARHYISLTEFTV